MESLRGQLLISNAGLFDPNFRRTVVLIGEHNDEGALGVVLNRPTELTVGEVVPPLAALVGEDERVFIGGPVQPQAAVLLGEFEDATRSDLLAFDSVGFVTGDVEAAAADVIRRGRVFAGYSGWGPGQLESEMEAGGWIVEPAVAEDVFTPYPDALWSMVLRRKGGDFALMATMPFDPSTN